jgi:asparagine synthase (glutamine-hydrolysing)
MCGLTGVVAWHDSYRIERQTLQRMSQSLAHRGPDGQEIWINHQQEPTDQNAQCALAFRRLAILDLHPRAMQPMTDGRRWLVFNGEIFNFRQLREQLTAIDPAKPWKTSGDSEVLLRAYETWGESCLDRLNGMFAFAVWDQTEGSLFLARDRMGQKPLFLAVAPDRRAVAFASELSALKFLHWPDTSTDQVALSHYLRLGYIPAPATIYRGISKLPPACCMTFRAGQLPRTHYYFDPNQSDNSSATAPADFRSLIATAVNRQLVADVPIGCFLSGGVDSSIIAAAMKAGVPRDQRVLTFSIGFENSQYDETPYAAAVAEHLGTEHQQFVVRPDALADLPSLAAVFGEPFADSSALPTHYLAKQTAQHVKVALSGDGGDELFGGYQRYRAMRLGKVFRAIPATVQEMVDALPGVHPKSSMTRMKRFVRSLKLPANERYAEYVALFDRSQVAALHPHTPLRDLVAETYARLRKGRDVVQAALATDRITYLPDDLLAKVDRASMLHALEVRSPFLDHELVARAAGLSTDQLLKGSGKNILREAFAADLPSFVFHRPKMGFAVPIRDWLRGSLRPMMHDLFDATDSFIASAPLDRKMVQNLVEQHETGKIDHSQRLYGLIMLELWWRTQKRR